MIDYDLTQKVGNLLLDNSLKNMTTKFDWVSLVTSKTIWLNTIVTIIGIATSLQGVAVFDKYATTLGVVTIVGNVILKIWFNNAAIASTPN